MAESTEELFLNIIPFNHPKKSVRFDFYREKQKSQMAPLAAREFPEGTEEVLNDGGDIDYLYTSFKKDDENADLQLEIDLTKAKKFARHYYNRCIFGLFKNEADARRMNFIYNNELWFRDKQEDNYGCRAYKRFEVRTSIARYTDQPELAINFQGYSYVLPRPVTEYKGPTTDLNWVIYRGYCFKYEDLPEGVDHIKYDEMYAVVNRDIRRRLGMDYAHRYVKNKMKAYYRQIEWFRKRFILNETFAEAFALEESLWYKPDSKNISRVNGEANELLFGGGNSHKVPHEGLKKFGPYQPPGNKNIAIFFIRHKGGRRETTVKLKDNLENGLRPFPGLVPYVNLPMQFMDEEIVFENESNPWPEINRQLNRMPFDDNIQYMAIYLSPIHKNEQDPVKHRVYFRLKEALLKHGASSQVIYYENVWEDAFKYHLANIAVAILAKLGGIPWQLKSPPRRELIVGVGAFRPYEGDHYIGSAFCFTNEGQFRGFQCFKKKETAMLAGSIREAVHQYVSDYDEPERLVIHYYKKMSAEERKPIMRVLRDLGLDIPVVIATINKTPSFDVVLFDQSYSGKMPVSGTYVRLDHHRLLLSNNTRYRPKGKPPRHHPFPVKVYVESGIRGFMHDEKNVDEIATQIYQFSRIYWKAITQQNLPVTIKYPEMVAEMFPHFENHVLPRFGRESLWFL